MCFDILTPSILTNDKDDFERLYFDYCDFERLYFDYCDFEYQNQYS